MSVPVCSLCNRRAVWSIEGEPFCEVHKEEIVARHGVDLFPIRRISEGKGFFTTRGRHKREPKPQSRCSATRKKSHKSHTT